jgi:hypothetical protein
MDDVSFNKIDYIERKIKIKKLFLTSFEDIKNINTEKTLLSHCRPYFLFCLSSLLPLPIRGWF